MGLKVKGPEEDAQTRALRLAAEKRAETNRTEQTQEILDEETRKRLRRFGSRVALGGDAGGLSSLGSVFRGGAPLGGGGFGGLSGLVGR